MEIGFYWYFSADPEEYGWRVAEVMQGGFFQIVGSRQMYDLKNWPHMTRTFIKIEEPPQPNDES